MRLDFPLPQANGQIKPSQEAAIWACVRPNCGLFTLQYVFFIGRGGLAMGFSLACRMCQNGGKLTSKMAHFLQPKNLNLAVPSMNHT